MKNFINKLKYLLLGGLLLTAGSVMAVQISVPSAPLTLTNGAYMLQSLTTGQWLATSTQRAIFGSYLATSTTATNLFMGPVTIATTTSGCATFSTSGQLFSTGTSCGTGSGGSSVYPFTTQTYGASTSTTLGFLNGFFATASSTIPITLLHLPGASDGCINITSGVLGSTGSGCGSASGLASYDAWTHAYLGHSATTSLLSFGTTTARIFPVTIASSTQPQLSLGDGTAGNSQFTFRTLNGNMYIATTTAQGLATSSVTALTVNNNGYVGVATGTPASLFSINGVANFDPATTSFSSIGGVNLKNGCFSVNGSCVGGVKSLVAGSNITLSPTNGLGDVTISASATAGSGLATTTADYIIYPTVGTATASTTNSLKTSTNTVISSSVDFGTVMRATIANATTTKPYLTHIYISPGTYHTTATSTFGGGNTNPDTGDAPMWIIQGAGTGATKIVVNKNTTAFHFTDFSKADVSGLTFYQQTGSTGISSQGLTTDVRSIWNSKFSNLFFVSTSSSDSGISMDMKNAFRNSYDNINFLAVQGCIRDKAEGTNFFTGDSRYDNLFCDMSSVTGVTPAYEFSAPAGGQVNQSVFNVVNAFSDSGTHTHFKLTNVNWFTAKGINSEGFATSTDIISGTGNNFQFNYITLLGTAGTTYFGTGATAYNNSFGCTFLDNPTNAHRVFLDGNTLFGQPNVLQGVNGANCVLQGSGSFTWATTTATVVRDIYDNVGTATWLGNVRITATKLWMDFTSTANTFIEYIGSAMRFKVGGNETMTITSTNVGVSTTTPGSVFSIGASATGINFYDNGTSTFSGKGINLRNGGCFAVNGTCVGSVSGGSGTVTSVVAGTGFQNQGLNITSSGTLVGAIATSATPTIGNLAYWTGAGSASLSAGLGTVATSSASCSGNVSCTSFVVLTGGGAITTINNPTFTTSVTSPIIIGGTGVGSSLTLQSTSGSGTTDFIKFAVGNNGGTEAGRILTNGQFAIATTTSWLNSILTAVGTTTIQGQINSLTASTTASATQSINWSSGNTQSVMLTANTNIVVNSTSSNPIDGGKYTIKICQDPTGSRTLTWANPVNLRWWNGTTTISSAANTCTFIGMIYTAQNGNTIYSVVASSTGVSIK